jgi:hypothetical protein
VKHVIEIQQPNGGWETTEVLWSGPWSYRIVPSLDAAELVRVQYVCLLKHQPDEPSDPWQEVTRSVVGEPFIVISGDELAAAGSEFRVAVEFKAE